MIRMTVLRIMRWEEFRNLVNTLSPDVILYGKDSHPLRRPPIGLRLIFYHERDMYVFIDYADGEALRKTGIPVRTADEEKGHLDDVDIRRFLNEQFGGAKLVPMGLFSID